MVVRFDAAYFLRKAAIILAEINHLERGNDWPTCYKSPPEKTKLASAARSKNVSASAAAVKAAVDSTLFFSAVDRAPVIPGGSLKASGAASRPVSRAVATVAGWTAANVLDGQVGSFWGGIGREQDRWRCSKVSASRLGNIHVRSIFMFKFFRVSPPGDESRDEVLRTEILRLVIGIPHVRSVTITILEVSSWTGTPSIQADEKLSPRGLWAALCTRPRLVPFW